MTKLIKKNLPRGTALGPTQVYDNLNTVVTALNGVAGAVRLDGENRGHSRGRFVMTWNMTAAQGKIQNFFNIPLLQEWFLLSHESTRNTPTIKLESLTLSWDRVGQQEGVSVTKNTPAAPALAANYGFSLNTDPDNVAYARIYQGAASDERVVGEVQVSKEEFARSAQETDFIEVMPKHSRLNVTVDPYKPYTMEIQTPFNATPIYSVVVKAEFSHPLVERDHAGLKKFDTTPQIPRNAPLHNNARVAAAYSLTAPVEGDSVDATGAKGVQTQIEALDDIVTNRLYCGLDRYSRIIRAEHLLEDQGYFCITVPLFNFENAITNANIEHYYNNVAGGLMGSQVWDRAIIPIVFPMAIHHVQLSFDTAGLTLGNWPLANRELQVGVGASFQMTPWAPRLYTQVARTPAAFTLDNTTQRIGNKGHWAIPLSYPGTPDGIGWSPQGRPVFVGKELGQHNTVGVVQRSVVADNANGAATVNPPTNGAEQVLEVRALLKHTTGSTLLNDAALGTYGAFPRGGVFVHIYGKSALVE